MSVSCYCARSIALMAVESCSRGIFALCAGHGQIHWSFWDRFRLRRKLDGGAARPHTRKVQVPFQITCLRTLKIGRSL